MFSGREVEWDASNRIWSWEKNIVYKGKCKDTGEDVAVKQIPYDSSKGKFEGIHPNLIREVTILRRLSPHQYIVQFHNTFCVNDNKRPLWNIVFEYLSCTLKQLIKQKLDPSNVKRLIYQILSGVAHCHSHSVIHRNLNSESILFEENSRRIKIAGFGLSRSCSIPFGVEEKFLKSYSPGVEAADISYQPPEFLLLSENYSLSSDMWSVGCIFAEMARGDVLFEANSCSVSQLSEIFSVLGTPTEADWAGVTSYIGWEEELEALDYNFTSKDLTLEALKAKVPALDVDGMDLLSQMLTYNPSERITAKKALDHAYFKNLDKTEL
ncbi:hypothetical protein M0R45_007593 [Rubus argutus]|uniref:cyclin-dependent kinase n=1 Tax=Rubus argutus TaxID=59490 RepID=A0AAW1XZL4_RUBAR